MQVSSSRARRALLAIVDARADQPHRLTGRSLRPHDQELPRGAKAGKLAAAPRLGLAPRNHLQAGEIQRYAETIMIVAKSFIGGPIFSPGHAFGSAYYDGNLSAPTNTQFAMQSN